MHRKSFAKWFIRIWGVMMAVYIAFAALSGVLMLNVDRLVYMEETGDEVRVCDVNLSDRKAHSYIHNAASEGFTCEISGFQAVRLRLSGMTALLPLWQQSYSGASDGNEASWAIKVYYEDNVRDIYGTGDWPLTYNLIAPKLRALGNFKEASKAKQNSVPIYGNTADI